MKLTVSVLAITAKLISGATVRWHECQPDTCQRIYFANHTSHLDALVLWSSLPGPIRDLTRPVAAKDYWGKGYATEAAMAVRDAAFTRWGYPEVISLIRPANTPSQRVAERLGMKPGEKVWFNGAEHVVFRAQPAN